MICPTCGKSDKEAEFSLYKESTPKHKRYCKKCLKARFAPYKEEVRRRRARATQTYFYNYLLAHPCVDCGETNPLVIGPKAQRLIKVELAKCEVRCANCHRIVTHKRANSIRWRLSQGEEV